MSTRLTVCLALVAVGRALHNEMLNLSLARADAVRSRGMGDSFPAFRATLQNARVSCPRNDALQLSRPAVAAA